MARIKQRKMEFLAKAMSIHGDKYDYSQVDYKNNHTKITVVCREHGPFEIMPRCHIFGRNTGCLKCSGVTTKEFIRRAIKVHGNRYDYSKTEYVRWGSKVLIICRKHGSFWQLPTNHWKGKGCTKCCGGIRMTQEYFLNKAQAVHHSKNYDYSKVRYKNAFTKIEIICPNHGRFWQQAHSHLSGVGCPGCSESKGERAISGFLEKCKLSFCRQVSFRWCKSKHRKGRLKFDFRIRATRILIEYDGMQHFGKSKGHDFHFESVRENDRIKNESCSARGWTLIRIPYTDFKRIDEILAEKLAHLLEPVPA